MAVMVSKAVIALNAVSSYFSPFAQNNYLSKTT